MTTDFPDDPEFKRLDWMATTLDSRFRIPGTRIRLGWDTLIGLVPGVGDLATLVPAAWILFEGYRLGARRRVLLRMAVNTLVDTAVGSVPVIGDIFDIGFKSNRRNVKLLRSDLAARYGGAKLPQSGAHSAS